MGFGDFLKNIFGKKTCAFCGQECGMMNRTKIKGDEFICGKCDDGCSKYIRKGRFTKPELLGHMEYMKRLDRIYKEVIAPSNEEKYRLPSANSAQGIEFYDSFGMFRIIDRDRDTKENFPVELFRYDTVAAWEPYLEEDAPSEPGKEKVFKECGIKLTFVGALDNMNELQKGLKAHPYILEPIKICFTKRANEKKQMLQYVENAVFHFNKIFGVNDDTNALFSFGMNKKEKRDLMGAIGFAKTAAEAVKVAKAGGEITEDEQAEIKKNMNAMDDAHTGGLAEYTRAADEAETKID